MNNYNLLNLNNIKEIVSTFASSIYTKKHLTEEEVDFNPLKIIKLNNATKEAMNHIVNVGDFSFGEIKLIDDILDKLKFKQVLTISEIYAINNHFKSIKNIKRNLIKSDFLSVLKDYLESLYINEDLIVEIENLIDNSYNIKENASEKYQNLLIKLDNLEEIINVTTKDLFLKYENSLVEKTLYNRNNRSCLLVKNSDKNKIKGIVVGETSSRLNSYIEPRELNELNNKRSDLIFEINKEIERIVKYLSDKIGLDRKMIFYNIESIIELDSSFAKARYGIFNEANVSEFNFEYNLELNDFKHPLIPKKDVVSNTYKLYHDKRALIISGSNTGGKTVALKSIGLSVLMAYLAIPINCLSSKIPFYDRVLISMDDVQSIEKSLSTFSSNMYSINYILNCATSKSLVLIDELASGSDAKEGEALSSAIILKLVDRNVSLVATTHFNKLKDLALKNNKMFLASVGFDEKKLKPTYIYKEDDYGLSNSLNIAEKYLDDKEIIIDAKNLLHQNQDEYFKILDEITILKNNLITQENVLKEEIIRNNESKNNYEKLLKEIEENKAEILADFLAEKNKILSEIKEEYQRFKKDKEIRKINQLIVENEVEEEFKVSKEVFNLKEKVRFTLTNQIGEIISLNGNNVEILINHKVIKTKLNNLSKTSQTVPVKNNYRIDKEIKRFDVPKEINVIGLNKNEALEKVSKFIDKLLEAKLKYGHIIHGMGKGILKDAIHSYLSKHLFVKEFKHSDINNGGSGATDIILK